MFSTTALWLSCCALTRSQVVPAYNSLPCLSVAQCRASLVGASDNALDPSYMEDWGTRGLAVDDCGVQEQVNRAWVEV